MGCCYCCCCTILVLVNIIYMIIGIVLAVAGILLVAAKNYVISIIVPTLQNSLQSLKANGGMNVDTTAMINGILDYLVSISVILIIVGSILFVLSIIGMCSVCCKSQCLIIIYLSIISAVLAIQIIVVIIYAANPEMSKKMINDLLKNMIAKYRGFTNTEPESFLVNFLNIFMNCCGATGYQDFNSSINFNRTFSGNFTYGSKSQTYNVYLYYPISCCKFKDFQFVNMNGCLQNQTDNNKDSGCTERLFNSIKEYLTNVYQVVGGIIGYQGLIIIAAVVCLVSLKQDLAQNVKPV